MKSASLAAILLIAQLGYSQTLNAPYLISVAAIDYQSVVVSWRNNDIAAQQIIILRKPNAGAWTVIDSAPVSQTSFTDLLVSFGTQYTYALIAKNPTAFSDTSNTIAVQVPQAPPIFIAPKMAVTWVEGYDSATIAYSDSSNTERGYFLYRREWPSNWQVIDSQLSAQPQSMGAGQFRNGHLQTNRWYTYKIKIAGTADSLFSPETTIYNYHFPKKTNKYGMTRLGAIPAHPISWVEQLGDSLFFPEIMGSSDTGIAVIDISNSSNPQFKSYLDPANLPASLRPTPVGARVVLGADCVRAKSSYLVFRQRCVPASSSLICYDSATYAIRDSTEGPSCDPGINFAYTFGVLGFVNDTTILSAYSIPQYMGTYHYAQPIIVKAAKIDTVSRVVSWNSGGGLMHWSAGTSWGCLSNRATYCFWNNSTANGGTFVYQDFSRGLGNPFTFSYQDTVLKFYGTTYFTVEDSTGCAYSADAQKGLSFYFFNILDAHAGPNSNLGHYRDSLNLETAFQAAFTDKIKRRIIIAGSGSIVLYGYTVAAVAIQKMNTSRNPLALLPVRIISTPSQIVIGFSDLNPKIIRIFNPAGALVSEASSVGQRTMVIGTRGALGISRGIYLCAVEDMASHYRIVEKIQVW
jgi:hypothetical protein